MINDKPYLLTLIAILTGVLGLAAWLIYMVWASTIDPERTQVRAISASLARVGVGEGRQSPGGGLAEGMVSAWPVTPRLSGPSSHRYQGITVSGSGRLLGSRPG